MDNAISRRQFLGKIVGIAAAATSIGALVSCSSIEPRQEPTSSIYYQKDFNISNITKANRLLMDFPERIPGAKKIDKYPIPGARYCLVHLRQHHLGEGNISRKERKQVIKDQEHVYSILSYLIDNHGLDSVYDEYFSKENVGEDGVPSEITTLMLNMKLNGKNTDAYKDAKYVLDATMNYGATERLAIEGRLKIKPAETAAGYHLLPELGEKEEMDGREDIAFELLSKEQGPLFVVVYGAGHAWGGKESCGPDYSLELRVSYKDNLTEWNKKHPDKKFSLIEIAPYGALWIEE